jgi:hypothetical protein
MQMLQLPADVSVDTGSSQIALCFATKRLELRLNQIAREGHNPPATRDRRCKRQSCGIKKLFLLHDNTAEVGMTDRCQQYGRPDGRRNVAVGLQTEDNATGIRPCG